jgi:hypothetical protein
MPIRGKFEPISDDAIKAREKIVESMIVMAKCAYGPHQHLLPQAEIDKFQAIFREHLEHMTAPRSGPPSSQAPGTG